MMLTSSSSVVLSLESRIQCHRPFERLSPVFVVGYVFEACGFYDGDAALLGGV